MQTSQSITDPYTGTILTNRSTRDDSGRQISMTQSALINGVETDIPVGTMTYNENNQITQVTDQTGLVIESTYDSRGLLIESRRQSRDEAGNTVWFATRTAYDTLGRVIATTDEYREGSSDPVNGTRMYYDAAGRVTETQSLSGLSISITTSGGNREAALASAGTVITSSATSFDASGRIISTTDSLGLQTQFTYDRFGQVTQTRRQLIDQNGQSTWLLTQNVYDSLGRVVLTTGSYVEGSMDPVKGTQTAYDSFGRTVLTRQLTGVQVAIAADGSSSVTSYGTLLGAASSVFNSKGQEIETTDALGNTISTEYDSLGRKVASISPSETVDGITIRLRTETVYDDATGRVVIVRSNIRQLADGSMDRTQVRQVSYTYDGFGNVIAVTGPDGSQSRTEYDIHGNKTATIDAMGNRTTYSYNDAQQLIAVSLPAVADPNQPNTLVHPTYTYEYDDRGNQILIRDPLQRETHFVYDSHGKLLSRTLPDGSTESYVYDSQGRTIRHVSFEGVVKTTSYDSRTGLVSSEKYYISLAAYDNGNGTAAETDIPTYDAFGRQTSMTVTTASGSVTRTNSYDSDGNISSVSGPEGTVSYVYDDFGRKIKTIVGTVDNPTTETQYSYDSFGRIASVSVVRKNGAIVDTNPNVAGNQPETTIYHYDVVGNVDEIDRPNGVVTRYTFDQVTGSLTSVVDYAPDSTPDNLADNPKIDTEAYTYNADGERTSSAESVWIDGAQQTNNFSWFYDADGRLVKEILASFNASLSETSQFTFDLVGNRLTTSVDKGNDGSIDQTTTDTFDVNDRLVSEADGTNLTTYGYNHTEQTSKSTVDVATQQTVATVNFTWTLADQMASITSTSFTNGQPASATRTDYGYNKEGTRVSATTSIDSNGSGVFSLQSVTQYLNDEFNETNYSQVIQESTFDASGNLETKIVYSIGQDRIGQTTYDSANPDGLSAFYLFDGHGSTRVLTDTAGAIMTIAGTQQTFIYDAYGNLVNMSASQAGTTFLYDGEQFDWKTGLLNLRRRMYDPSVGRLVGLDNFSGTSDDPLSYNKYLFTHADPIDGSDPSGNMLILLDGTNNDQFSSYPPMEGGPAQWAPTNIYKLWLLTDVQRHGITMRQGDYFYGVGSKTDSYGQSAWGSAKANGYGEGIQKIIAEAMDMVRFERRRGDTEFNVIGFSRGAIEATELSLRVAEQLPDLSIHFVGLFDPVGTIGYAGQFRPNVRGRIPATTQVAWQAIAAGETRNNFAATFIPGASYRFFPGNHGDIGGGWAEHGASDRVLEWMYDKYLGTNPNVGLNPLSTLPSNLYSAESENVIHTSPTDVIYSYESVWGVLGGAGWSPPGAGNRLVAFNVNPITGQPLYYNASQLWDTTQGADHAVNIADAASTITPPNGQNDINSLQPRVYRSIGVIE